MIRAALLLFVLLCARTGRAEPVQAVAPPPLVVIRSQGHAEFGRRLQGYLQGNVWALDYSDGPVIANMTYDQAARAVVWLVERPDVPVLEVHLIDLGTSREVVREVPFDAGTAGSASAAMEAAALIVGATLEEWHAAESSVMPQTSTAPEPVSEAGLDVQRRMSRTAPPSKQATSPGISGSRLVQDAAEQQSLGASAAYQGVWSGGTFRHGPAVEFAWLERWFLGVRLAWSAGTWGLTGQRSADAANVRIHVGSVGLLVGPRLGSASADLWLVPSIGAEVGYVSRRTTWVSDDLQATARDSYTTVAIPARLMLEAPSWCFAGQNPCTARARFTMAAQASLFARRPLWGIRDASGVTTVSSQWRLVQPGAELGLRVEF